MATIRSLAVARRSLVARSSFHSSALRAWGRPPPLAPFARSPARFEKMAENSDCVWDDGVAPELALDFDAPNVTSREALFTFLGVLGGFATFFYAQDYFAPAENPALCHTVDMVDKDWTNFDEAPLDRPMPPFKSAYVLNPSSVPYVKKDE